ncbi:MULTISPECIES: AraC family transcriptional regulator [unclassified Acidovorax]|uniref:AraC family transcriptional regulator n=1 Tax=unclassified Acidovorax TaxID=2684926 RepID=UPI0028834C2B|nr:MULTISPECIES: AraC family transcriptional regulator [unclassified Acidovorax]
MSAFPHAMDLSRVYSHPVFRTTSIPDSCRQLGPELSEHRLRCGAGDIDYSLHSAHSRRAKMMILRYGPEVEVHCGGFQDFFLVQMPLRGCVDILSDGHRMTVEAGQAVVVAPQRELRLNLSRDSEQLILRLPRQLMHEAAQACGSWRSRHGPVDGTLTPASRMDGVDYSRWAGLVQGLMSGLPGDDAQVPAWLEEVEFGLALFLLTQQRRLGDTPADDGLTTPRADSEPLAAAERYAMARLCAPLSLEDLARAAGVSSRTLHLYCKRRFGVGPMVWLRQMRLDAARQKLSSGRDCRITDVAMDHGFGHLGRFSSYYQQRFGELPRETTARR